MAGRRFGLVRHLRLLATSTRNGQARASLLPDATEKIRQRLNGRDEERSAVRVPNRCVFSSDELDDTGLPFGVRRPDPLF